MSHLPVPLSVLNAHCAVLGKTGAGKSSLLRVIVEDLLRRGKRVCVVDPKGDWYGLKLSADGKSAGFPVITFGDFVEDKASDVPINEHSGRHIAELISSGNRPCVIGFRGWMPGKMTRFWIDFASTLFNSKSGELYLVGDEFHNFAPKGKVMDPEAGKSLHWSNRLLSEGRGLGLVILIASQRPQKVHNDTLTCCETLFAMRVVHAADRGAIEDWIEGCGDKAQGALVLNSIAGMARGEAFVWCPEHGFGPKRIQFPMFSTFDSFAPPQLQKKISAAGWAGVDLDAVKEKLAKVIEEAKANDPTELKRENARLKRELEAKPKAFEPLPPKEVPILDAHAKDLLEKMINRTRAIEITSRESTETIQLLLAELAKISANLQVIVRNADRAELRRTKPALMREVKRILHEPRAESNGESEPGKGAREVLKAAAQHTEGVTDEQIAVLTGYKKTSRTTFKQQLFSRGLLGRGGRGFVATQDGIDWLGNDFSPLPTGAELRNHWIGKLSGGELELFMIYVAHYPSEVSIEELMTATGYQKTSVTTFRQKLSARNLIVGKAASPNLFD